MKNKFKILMIMGLILIGSFSFAQNHATTVLAAGPCDPIVPLVCPSGVLNPDLAVDNDLSTYATMVTFVGVANSSFLKMGFPNPAPASNTVAVFIGESIALDVNVLASITLTLYNSADQEINTKQGLLASEVTIDDDHHGIIKIKVPANQSAASVQISVGGLVLVDNNVDVFGTTWGPDNVQVYADYVYAEGPCDPIVPLICPGGCLNSERSVDANRRNYATLTIPVGVNGNAFLDLGFSTPGTPGALVVFVLGVNTLPLEASLINSLRMTVYDQDGNVVKEKKSFSMDDVTLLSDNKFWIHIKTPAGSYQIARAKITLKSLVSVLTDVRVYNCYYKGRVNWASFFRTSESIAGENALTIYPNPASTSLNVTLNSTGSEVADAEIFNLLGESVYAGKLEPGTSNTLNVDMLDNGIYWMRIRENGEFISQKFVIQR